MKAFVIRPTDSLFHHPYAHVPFGKRSLDHR
jgi:hypothetical protein